jgi:hypothetical protein
VSISGQFDICHVISPLLHRSPGFGAEGVR